VVILLIIQLFLPSFHLALLPVAKIRLNLIAIVYSIVISPVWLLCRTIPNSGRKVIPIRWLLLLYIIVIVVSNNICIVILNIVSYHIPVVDNSITTLRLRTIKMNASAVLPLHICAI